MSNVTAMPAGQPTPSARFKITVELDGFPVEIEAEGKADSLKALVERLKAIGAVPPQSKPDAPASAQSAPRCPIHHKSMKASRKPGSFFCPARFDDGSYCDEKA